MKAPSTDDAQAKTEVPISPPPLRVEMTPADYLKILLDSSFKESATMWTRNGALLTFNSVIFGFFINYVRDDFSKIGTTTTFLFSLLGIYVGILDLLVVRVSSHYNQIWYKSFEGWVKKQNLLSSFPKDQSPWAHLSDHIVKHDTLPFPGLHSSGIAKLLAITIIGIWLGVFVWYMVKSGMHEIARFFLSLC